VPVFEKSTYQADAVLPAFRYQLAQSLATWLDLGDDEELWLACSEDFTRTSDEIMTDVQVKSSTAVRPPTHSLQSLDVQAALLRFCDRAESSSDRRLQLVFLAHGAAAAERSMSFPDGQAGLVYWQAAARDADTGPIRSALSGVFANTPIGNWLEGEPTDEELRERLLRRVTWALNAPTAEALDDYVLDRVTVSTCLKT
jgi:hypothetical protein